METFYLSEKKNKLFGSEMFQKEISTVMWAKKHELASLNEPQFLLSAVFIQDVTHYSLFTTNEAARSSSKKRLSCGCSSAEGDPVFTSLPVMSTSVHFHLNGSVQKNVHDRNRSQVQGKFMRILKRTDQSILLRCSHISCPSSTFTV